jgi:glycosyltransferase involved in cell wall biosynthesis
MIESAVHKAFGFYRRNLDRVVVPSQFYKNKLMDWGWPEHQLAYIPNYVDANAYTPLYDPGDYFFYFGRLAMEKGLGTLIRAAALAGVRVKIAGTGPEADALKLLAQECSANVEFLGFVCGDPLWQLVREARAVVLPSEWYENAPMSVLESYACGTPVIGASIGGIPELVQEGVTGSLFASGSDTDLAILLRDYAAMPNSRIAEMGVAARQLVANIYTAERYFLETIALYGSLGVPVRNSDIGRLG